MTPKQFKSFKEFYPFYLSQHRNKINLALHFVGTTLVLFFLIFSIWSHQPLYLLLMPFSGYAFAWMGHLFFEKNKPATFTYPLWSLIGDFMMYYHILTLQIEAKLKESSKTDS